MITEYSLLKCFTRVQEACTTVLSVPFSRLKSTGCCSFDIDYN